MSKKKGGLGKFLLGAGLGVGLGMLFSPKTGKENRQDLKKKIDELITKIKNIDSEEVKQNIQNKIDSIMEEIADLDMSYTILDGVNFIGNFTDLTIIGANFRGSRGAVINPQEISDGMLQYCVFSDVIFIGPFDKCTITNSSFKGSTGAVININTINGRVGDKADLTDASFKLGFPKTNGDEDYQRRR